MDKTSSLGPILLFLILSFLAISCASGSDTSISSSPSRSADGKILPEAIRNSFVDITGSQTTLGRSTTSISTTTPNGSRSVTIDSFKMMNTEVTIEMYVEFLNSEVTTTDTTSTSSTTTTNRDDHFKSGMNNDVIGGIFRTDSTGGIILTDGSDIGSGIISSTSTTDVFLVKPYIDPFQHHNKVRRNTDSTIIYKVSPGRSRFPISYVSRDDAIAFTQWLGAQYRLPTEDEWEYAAKGGRTDIDFGTVPYTKPDEQSLADLYTELHLYSNFQGEFTERSVPSQVGSYNANDYGLYDMIGNVYEWTLSSKFEGLENFDSGSTSGVTSYLRGGSWSSRSLTELTVWGQVYQANPENYFGDVGFRVVFQATNVFTLGQSTTSN